ncbi:uncharacterized protein BYT42DRAFT_554714 [Radiomyces spectabilis]|uniref:uncharacterized protein n=1 Tax=Radiomyces spectabilis TaxID=64574 RepID=UPI00221FDEE6|nr:uncharacterized protein BYT42DRAFT_554714 [Radiomyces spectabilis]KAI8390899.1 hypothetical protein BYT42DRAFT_554714 [Radiomyces spectabilis]
MNMGSENHRKQEHDPPPSHPAVVDDEPSTPTTYSTPQSTPQPENNTQIITTPPTPVTPSPSPSAPERGATQSAHTTDDEHDPTLSDHHIPTHIPLEALAGPALVTAPDLDGRTLAEEFDWGGRDDDEDDEIDQGAKEGRKKRRALAQNNLIICISRNSSFIAWGCIVLFALILIAVDVAIFVVYNKRDVVTTVSYNLELWFTFLAFMWCIGFLCQVAVELVPWAIKTTVGYVRPHSSEVLRMRLSYYMALRPYIKLVVIAAWAWGSWAFIRDHVDQPTVTDHSKNPPVQVRAPQPSYVGTFFSIWEACFFAALLLFIEKFILQLIVTSFHKKAYGDRIKSNDKALKTLDKLKRVKRKNPQEFLLKRIRRKQKNPTGSAATSRSPSVDEMHPDLGHQRLGNNRSIMNTLRPDDQSKANVRFPSQNMDTLIAIPPLEDRIRSDDEKYDLEKTDTDPHSQSVKEKEKEPAKKKVPFFKRWRAEHHNNAQANPPEESKTRTAVDAYGNRTTSPPLISRNSTAFSRSSSDEKSFLGATKDFGLGAGAIPGKLLKGGYRKILNAGSTHASMPQSSSAQAKALAKRIYHNLVGPEPTRNSIVESDLYPFFRTHEEAADAFALFDLDGNGDISKRELRSGCIRIYRERKNLATSMRDLSQATGKLDIILIVIFVVIWVIIVLAAFGVNVGTELMPLWSAFIAASFIFGNSAKDAFEAIIFVFVTHPFDAGDRVMIGLENWVVDNVGLLVTTFIKWDGSVVYAKNSVLATQYIINCRRTGRTGECVDLHVHFSTPSEKIRQLISHMTEWSNQFPKLYTTNATSANVISFENQNRITLTFYFEHTQNWQDPGGRWLRHNNFMWELKEESERLGINYSLPPQPLTGKPNDAPPELYNMGNRSDYGLNGMQRRRPYEYEDGVRGPDVHGDAGGHAAGSSNDVDPGAAATLMFAASSLS